MYGDPRELSAAVFNGGVGQEPGEGGCECGEGLVSVEPPASFAVGRERGLRTPAALRGTEVGLRGDLVAERAVFDDGAEDAFAQRLGPDAVGALRADAHQVHTDGERQRHIRFGERRLGGDQIGQCAFIAAVLAGHGGAQPTGVTQVVQRVEGERGVAVVDARTFGDARQRIADARDQLSPRVVGGRQRLHGAKADGRLENVAERLERANADFAALFGRPRGDFDLFAGGGVATHPLGASLLLGDVDLD